MCVSRGRVGGVRVSGVRANRSGIRWRACRWLRRRGNAGTATLVFRGGSVALGCRAGWSGNCGLLGLIGNVPHLRDVLSREPGYGDRETDRCARRMEAPNTSSLTGSSCGAPPTHSASTSLALGRLRAAALVCCWVIGCALLGQSIVWAIVTYTDLRWETIVANDVPMVVTGEEVGGRRSFSPLDDTAAAAVSQDEPKRALSVIDAQLRLAGSLAGGLGMIGIMVLLPLLALAVLLATSSATQGVERVVSAFTWSIVLAILLLPVLRIVDFPWEVSALWSYEALTAEVDHAGESLSLRGLARFVLLPFTCLVGITLVGAQLSAGVAAGLMRRESLKLDPELERETSGIKPSSLHASRAAAAMERATRVLEEQVERDASAASKRETAEPSPPRRLI